MPATVRQLTTGGRRPQAASGSWAAACPGEGVGGSRPASLRGRATFPTLSSLGNPRSSERKSAPPGCGQQVLSVRLLHPSGDGQPDQGERHVLAVVPAGQ